MNIDKYIKANEKERLEKRVLGFKTVNDIFKAEKLEIEKYDEIKSIFGIKKAIEQHNCPFLDFCRYYNISFTGFTYFYAYKKLKVCQFLSKIKQ